MKTLIILSSIVLTSVAAFAKPVVQPKCANQAIRAAVAKNYKSLNVSTGSCGAKALNIGDQLETFVVCTTDETDPMEYVVAVVPTEYKNDQTTKSCVVKFVGVAHEASLPSFETDDGLVQGAHECTVDADEGVIRCK